MTLEDGHIHAGTTTRRSGPLSGDMASCVGSVAAAARAPSSRHARLRNRSRGRGGGLAEGRLPTPIAARTLTASGIADAQPRPGGSMSMKPCTSAQFLQRPEPEARERRRVRSAVADRRNQFAVPPCSVRCPTRRRHMTRSALRRARPRAAPGKSDTTAGRRRRNAAEARWPRSGKATRRSVREDDNKC